MKNKVLYLILFIICILLSIFIYFLGYECPIHKYLYLYCPGCGITRMFIAIFSFDILYAIKCNAYVFFLLLFILIYIFLKYILKINIILDIKFYYSLLVLLVIFTILRNIPMFSFLIP